MAQIGIHKLARVIGLRFWAGCGVALLGSAGCGSGSSCVTYACENQVYLTGAASIGREATLIDVHLCVDGACRDGAIDLTSANAADPCLNWGGLGHVCLKPTGAAGTLSVDAASELASDATPHDASVQLQLKDHSSGSLLLDETRTATHQITEEDSCHSCWNAKATL